MEKSIIQSFRLPGGIIVFSLIPLIVYIGLYLNDNTVGLAPALIMAAFSLAFIFTRFRIAIDEHEIAYRFFPLQLKSKTILWTNVVSAEILTLSALSDFQGYGLRYSKKKGWGYIFDTKHLLKLTLSNGKQISFSIDEETAKSELLNAWKGKV